MIPNLGHWTGVTAFADLSDAVPRLAFMDHPSEELYWPILDSPDLAYKLYPIKLRPLPGAEDEPTGLIQDERFRPADTYANDHPTWVPDYPDSNPTSLVSISQRQNNLMPLSFSRTRGH